MGLRRGVLGALLHLVPFAFSARPAAAQRWQVELGGTTVRYDSVTTRGSGSLGSQIELIGPGVQSSISGSISAMDSSQWSGQGRGDLGLFWGPTRALNGWGGGWLASVAGSAHSSGYRTGTVRTEARLEHSRPRAGVWVGLAGAAGWSSFGAGNATSWGPTAGVWTRSGGRSFAVLAAPFRLNGSWFPELDAQVSLSAARLDILGYAGWRGAPLTSGLSRRGWAGGTIAWWFVPRAALVLGGGSYPADLVQAVPGGRYFSFGVRVSSRRTLTPSGPFRQVSYLGRSGATKLSFAVPGARRVEVAGDWTGWQAVPLVRRPDGRWVLPVQLGSGVHDFNLVVDGNHWIIPEGFPAVDDGFGGKAALLVVP